MWLASPPRPAGRVFNTLRANNPELTGKIRRTTLKPPQVRGGVRAACEGATCRPLWLLALLSICGPGRACYFVQESAASVARAQPLPMCAC